MPSISGKVSFNASRTGVYDAANPGIPNVPIVLQNTSTNVRLVVLTDVNGDFQFTNVPNGSYRLVEAYGTTGGVTSPGNFATAAIGAVPTGQDPPISSVATAPVGATNLDSLSPNTLLVTVAGANVTAQYFLDGPVKYISLIDTCITTSGSNLITAGDNGIYGTYAAGTPVDYAPATDPYPGITEGTLTYSLTLTGAGVFTLRNIYLNTKSPLWWKASNKTTGDETSGMFIADPAGTGSEVAFSQVVTVQPNTKYIFSLWVMNLMKVTGYLDPYLSVEVLDSAGGVILDQFLSAPIAPNTSYPEWKQVGTTIDTGANSTITVKVTSNTLNVNGNDFAIDDVQLKEIVIPEFTPVKTVDKETAFPGDTVTYTISIENTCQSDLTSVTFQDNVPVGTVFVDDSVTIDTVAQPGFDPQAGFSLPDIAGGATTTITYQATVLTNFTSLTNFDGIVQNEANISYNYTPIVGGVVTTYSLSSNTVTTDILRCDFLAQQYIDIIENVYALNCENMATSMNTLITEFNDLLKATKEYVQYISSNNTDLTCGFKSQLGRYVDILSSYISMTNALKFTTNCNVDVYSNLIVLIVDTSLILSQIMEFLCGIISFSVGLCGCSGDVYVDLLIGRFINAVTKLQYLSEEWRPLLAWIYQVINPTPNYVAAYMPRQSVSINTPQLQKMKFACPPPPPCPPQSNCGC